MEEMCRETAKARAIFDRWMAFEPDHAAWMAYIKVSDSHTTRPADGLSMLVVTACMTVGSCAPAGVLNYARFFLCTSHVPQLRPFGTAHAGSIAVSARVTPNVHAVCALLVLQFEMRYDEVDRARAVFERYVEILPTVKAWVRCAATTATQQQKHSVPVRMCAQPCLCWYCCAATACCSLPAAARLFAACGSAGLILALTLS